MKTRYSALVSVKKNALDKSERLFQRASTDLNNASKELELSYKTLQDLDTPKAGSIGSLLASRVLLASQRGVIDHNKEWLSFAQKQLQEAQNRLKKDMIEYEKYKYLELEEVKKVLQEEKIKEAKRLDEVASITFYRKNEGV
ncbi:MAG: flagellar export protein FliJ [Thiovulaceae bacterium]|nr:flagellar export protein FliJ [Sulfurimonadaceae bacterium]